MRSLALLLLATVLVAAVAYWYHTGTNPYRVHWDRPADGKLFDSSLGAIRSTW